MKLKIETHSSRGDEDDWSIITHNDDPLSHPRANQLLGDAINIHLHVEGRLIRVGETITITRIE